MPANVTIGSMGCSDPVQIIGGGLAGCEAAWQVAKRGIPVVLHEMRPQKMTPAHRTSNLAEIICSNSFGSKNKKKASGLLLHELRLLDSLLIACADSAQLPAGHALAVDRERFSSLVQESIKNHPDIHVKRGEISRIPSTPAIIASGPLTSDSLAAALIELTDKENLFFYDALAPIIEFSSINMDIAFWGSRYHKGVKKEGDYINCPFTKEQYDSFIHALVSADQIKMKEFESEVKRGVKAGKSNYFEGCLPIEVMAKRGHQTLAFGPLRPVGLRDPKTGERPFAVVQLRQDDLYSRYFNLVGFQTNLKFSEQLRVFRMIPGLESARVCRYGQMHRNTYIFSPEILYPTLESKKQKNLFFAGQITGVEGYLGCIATGLVAGVNLSRSLKNHNTFVFPRTTMIGGLCRHITHAESVNFQPIKANFRLLPQLDEKVNKKEQRYEKYSERAIIDLERYLAHNET